MALGELADQVMRPQGGGSGPNTESLVNSYVAAGGSQSPSGPQMTVAGSAPAATPRPMTRPFAQDQPLGGGMTNTIASMYMPEIEAQRWQQQNLLARLGLNDADLATQRSFMQQNYGLDMRGLGLDRRSLGLEREGLGIDQQAAARQYRNTLEMERLARAMTGNQKKQIGLDYEGDVRGAHEDATARGAFTAPGHRSTLRDLFGNLQLGNQRLDLGLEQDLLGIREQRAGTRDRQRHLGISSRQLDIEADRLGLRGDQLRTQLSQGLANLGIQNMLSANDIFSSLASGNAQQAAIARQIMQDILTFGSAR